MLSVQFWKDIEEVLMGILDGRIYVVCLNVISDLDLLTVSSLSIFPQNWPSHSLDLLFSCFLGHLNLPWLSSCIKCRAFLSRDIWSPFSCTFLSLIITFNVTGSVAIWGVISKRDLFIHSCTHQSNVFFTDPQGYTPLPLDHGRAQRGGRREHWDGSSEGRWILGKMGSHWMVPTPHSVYLILFG